MPRLWHPCNNQHSINYPPGVTNNKKQVDKAIKESEAWWLSFCDPSLWLSGALTWFKDNMQLLKHPFMLGILPKVE